MPEKLNEKKLLEEINSLREKLSNQQQLEKQVRVLKQSLKNAEEMNSKLAMASLDAVMKLDLSGTVIYASERAAELYGAESVAELMGKNVKISLSGEDLDRFNENIKKLLVEGFVSGSEYSIRKQNGESIYVELSSAVMKDSDGKPTGFISSIRDITRRKKLERELVESINKYKTLFETAYDAITVHEYLPGETDGRILEANEVACRMIGLSRGQLLKKKLSDFMPPEATAISRKAVEQISQNGHCIFETMIRADNITYQAEVSAHMIDFAGKKAIISVIRDISRRKKTEKILEDSAKTVRKIMNGIIMAMEKLVEKKDIYTVGHQNRTADLAAAIASEMGLDKDRIAGIYIAAVIHDIGKIFISGSILNKKAKLTGDEYDIIKQHPQAGFDVLKNIDFPWPIAQIVLQHHERINGSGYPNGLKDGQILLEARIISIADVVEAITFERPYHEAYGIERALEEIESNKGTLYDPEIVDVCIKLFREKGYVLNDELKDRDSIIL
ncbi:MAG: PAS domain S-box protein [Candidatus Goldbacteria bacterium]|nr:PAS domain S-box protein [Candidatus Goldiibacteriota bacterium]